MTSQNSTDWPPESLRPIAHWLTRNGYVIGLKRVRPGTLSPGPGVVNTISGWRLTWSRKTTKGWVECGSLLVEDGEVPFPTTILSTSG